MGASTDYTFTCPECEEVMEVNQSMKDALEDHGCVICGTTVTDAAFEPADSAES